MKNAIQDIAAICFGEVLWDILPDGPQPGGAPLNVAYHLNKLGVKSSVISRIGADMQGEELSRLIDQGGIDRSFLQVDENYPTSEVIATINDNAEVSYDIVMPVAWDFISENSKISDSITASTYLVFGSLASRGPTTRNTLFELLESDAIKVLDINLRPPFIDTELLRHLLTKADIVKFNNAEFEMVLTSFQGPAGTETDKVGFIMNAFGVKEVIITKGEAGASYYTGDHAYHQKGKSVKVSDTIGSGDSFLAAFIAGHYLREPPQVVLKNAIAMGAFIATRKGGCPEYAAGDYFSFRDAF